VWSQSPRPASSVSFRHAVLQPQRLGGEPHRTFSRKDASGLDSVRGRLLPACVPG
jgi:hypothetical protein